MSEAPVDVTLSLGKQLSKAREARHLSENDVAQQLLLSKQLIIDLENDNYSRIVAPVYARGYLKAYAGFLGLSVDNILADFEKLNIYSQPKLESTTSTEVQKNRIKLLQNRWVRWSAIGGLVLLILIFVIAALPSHEKASDVVKAEKDNAVEQTVKLDNKVDTNSASIKNDINVNNVAKETDKIANTIDAASNTTAAE
jgi:cytoskeletal protein RodZ